MAKKKRSGRPKVTDKKKPFPIRTRDSLISRYRDESKRKGLSINFLMEQALIKYDFADLKVKELV